MKNKLTAIILVLVLAASAAGCRKTGGSSEASADGESGASEVTSVESSDEESEAEASEEASGAASDTKSSSGANNPDKTATGSKNTTSTESSAAKDSSSNVKAAQKVTVKDGNTPLESNLNFGGKTFTMATTQEEQFNTNAFKRMKAAFETKYNCKITVTQLTFGTYNTQVTQALSAGQSYDICFQHGSMYPAGIISKLYKGFGGTITTADLTDKNNLAAGGIDLAKSSYFAYKGELYGLCDFYNTDPLIYYYNKKMFKDKGLEDPLDLYKSGKWTWDKLKSMGQKVTNAGADTYFLSFHSGAKNICITYGSPFLSVADGNAVEYMTSTAVTNGMNMFKSLHFGSNAIAAPTEDTSSYNLASGDFVKGKVYMYQEESSKFTTMSDYSAESTAFGKNRGNLGIVPLPVAKTNASKMYPVGWLRGVFAGIGTSDIRAAAAWAKFESSYTDVVEDKNAMSKEYQKLCDDLLLGAIGFDHGLYSTSEFNTLDLTTDWSNTIKKGSDIAQATDQYRSKVQACINATPVK